MRLTDLLTGSGDPVGPRPGSANPGSAHTGIGQACVRGLTSDSRQVEPGYLFAALPGTRVDGRGFIADALRRGAVAVLAPPGATLPPAVAVSADAAAGRETHLPLIIDENPRRRFALMAAQFFAEQPTTIAAVTGTNGKTSVVNFLRQIWSALGEPAASLGTLGVHVSGGGIDQGGTGALTTPDPVAVHRALAHLAQRGIQHLALEASSHGLDQCRLDGVRIQAAAFTNLSRDHLDYHGSMERYFAAKRRLFTDLLAADGTAVINADTAQAEPLAEALSRAGRAVRIVTYGERGRDVRLQALEVLPDGQRLTVVIGPRVHEIIVPLVGHFQIANVLAALALAIATGSDAAAATMVLADLTSVRGRIERVARLPNGAAVYVDYAHTPDGLAAVLAALRPHATGRLIVAFGCGGDRDRGKRPEMGRMAARLADAVIVTDDNPRSEDPAAIRAQILAACPHAREIGDRAEAIDAGIQSLAAGDVLVVAGKGHETGQIVGDHVLPFDDAEVVRACVAELDR